jgi:hypothetical protein
MPPAKHKGKTVNRVIVSCTDLPQFKRLVQFVGDTTELAKRTDNAELLTLLNELAQDLTEQYE